MIDKLKSIVSWFPDIHSYLTVIGMVLIIGIVLFGIGLLLMAPGIWLLLALVVVCLTATAKMVERHKLDLFDIFCGK
jgi:hypothetical protein